VKASQVTTVAQRRGSAHPLLVEVLLTAGEEKREYRWGGHANVAKAYRLILVKVPIIDLTGEEGNTGGGHANTTKLTDSSWLKSL
jgi:hypothetical protein